MTVTIRVTEGELALLQMALIDMARINVESMKKAPIDPNAPDAAKRHEARARVTEATKKLMTKIENANRRFM